MLCVKCMLLLSFIYVSAEDLTEEKIRSLVEVDYSLLAGQAERNKHDILNFLNQSSVREQYKSMYCMLLERLISVKDVISDSNPEKENVLEDINTICPARKVSQNRRDDTSQEFPKQKRKLMLGINDNTLSETRRIVFGQNTSIAAVPWQVSLREKSFPICGGSVVSDIWLLTAAHCLLRARSSDLSVRLGSSWKTHGGEMYDVKECYVHPRYLSKTKINDVGLVRLYSPLRFSNTVLPINVVERESRLHADEVAIVSGWGKLQESGASATFLQSAMVKTIAMKDCLRSGLDRKAINPPSMFCAGSFKQPSPDACQGDSGGPLVKDGVLIGVVSWGLGCARGNFPGVYTRLSHPIIWDWVQSHLARKIERSGI